MAKNMKKEEKLGRGNPLYSECEDQFSADWDALETERSSWEDREKTILCEPTDSYTEETTTSQVNDPELLNAIIKRTNSTVGQLHTGKCQAISKQDTGKNILMNTILQKYIIPNAKNQYDIYTKSWLLEFYSLFYGTQDVLVDYVISDKYVGPDFYLLDKRLGIPQKGKATANDCDRYFVITHVSKSWLLDRDTKNWKNIDKLIAKPNTLKDPDTQSYIEKEKQDGNDGENGKNVQNDYELITRYEADRWVTFSRNAKIIFFDNDNPHNNDEIPIVSKHCFPLLGRYHGLAEYEKLISLQNSLNSLINLYMDGVKMSIFPPMKIYLKDVVASTILNEPGAKWVLKQNNPNAITQHIISPQGIQSFQSTYSFLKGALLNIAATSDTSISESVDPGMGKTPQALKMQDAFDQARTNFDQKMMDNAMSSIYDKMINLVAKKQEKPIKLHLSKEDIDPIKQYAPDVVEMFDSNNYGEVVIKPKNIRGDKKDIKYKYFIDSGTSAKKDTAVENETLTSILTLVFKTLGPAALQQILQTGKVTLGTKSIDVAETLKRWVITSGIQDWEKIVTEIDQGGNVNVSVGNGVQGQVDPMAQMVQQAQQMPQGGQPMPPQGQQPPMTQQQPPMQQPQGGMGQNLSPQAQALMNELMGGTNGAGGPAVSANIQGV